MSHKPVYPLHNIAIITNPAICRPYVARVIVTAIFSLSKFALRAHESLYVNESSAQIFSKWNIYNDSFLIDDFLNLHNSTDLHTSFFQASILCKNGVPLVELKNNIKLIDCLEHVYKLYSVSGGEL